MATRPLPYCMGIMLLGGAALAAAAPEPNRGERMLEGYFRHQTGEIARNCLSDIRTRADWERQRPELRRQFLEMMGLWPLPPRTDLRATVTGKLEDARFTIEKLHFQSSPGLYVTGNLYVPRGLTRPAPAILYVCGHANTVVDKVSYGSKVNYQHHPAWFAEHGYVCLIVDTLQLGEIEGVHHGTHPRFKYNWWWWHTVGYTPAGIECWNAMRALDYLETRKEVDPKRIGVTGRSGGGATSWWLAAADDRPQCIIPVAGIADLHAHVVEGIGPRYASGVISGHCDCMYFVNTYRWDFPLVAALCAPRPLMLGNSDRDDIFPVPGYRRLADRARKIYDLYGAGDRFMLLETEGPHRDTPELRLGAYRWMNRWLKGEPGDTSEQEKPRFLPAQLKVFERLPEDAINTTIHETFIRPARPELPRVPAVTREWWPGQRQKWHQFLRDTVFHGWPDKPEPLKARLQGDHKSPGWRLRAYDFTSEAGIELRLWILTVPSVARPKKVTLAVLDEPGWQEWAKLLRQDGAPHLDDPAFEPVRKRLEAGHEALALIAPRGVGPTRWCEPGTPEDSHIRRRFVLLGQTLDGQQVWDVRRGLALLKETLDMKDVPVELQGKREMAGIALYASLFEPGVSQLDLWDLPASHRQGPTLLNVRRTLDLPQAVALAFPHPIRLHTRAESASRTWEWPLQLQKALGQEYLKIIPIAGGSD